MALLTSAPRGTQDVLPADSYKWQYVEKVASEEAKIFGYRELRTPTFEHTELFHRAVGDTTDVVQKEMYTFKDKGDRSITLKPEGTAGAVRSLVENGLLNDTLPVKVFYITPCFRYEKPQAGRLREFHQFGVEAFGSANPVIDAETIQVAHSILTRLGISNLSLEINSIGCPTCRAKYHQALYDYFDQRKDQLCDTCKGRLQKNPMRILDCKNETCKEIAAAAPKVLDYICDDCRAHFEGVKKALDAAGIAYAVNPTIVRGLDYYTRTVFEFLSNDIGSQSAVCAGGRYDGLVEEMGGKPLPALGFGMGLERLILVMERNGCDFQQPAPCDIYIGSMGEKASSEAFRLVSRLRRDFGIYAECDLMGRSVKAQMKYANKIGARFSAILGENELEQQKLVVKNMASGESRELDMGEGFLEKLADHMAYEQLYNACEDVEKLFHSQQ